MNMIIKNMLRGMTLPLTLAMGQPCKWKTDKFARPEKPPLKFRADGTFRILHLTDIHLVDPAMDDDENPDIPKAKETETLNCIRACLEEAKPDLVVLGGDNISGFWQEFTYDFIEKTINRIIEPIKELNIPLALVFGNHDGEAGFHAEIQMCMYLEYDNCRMSLNEADIFGCGNCHLPVLKSSGLGLGYNIWLIDSNDYIRLSDGKLGYAHVHDDQIEWYEKTAEKLKAENGGQTVPAVLFQHMPVQQELDLLQEAEKGTENAIEHGGKAFSYGEKLLGGRLREYPCPPNMAQDRRSQLKSWAKTGDIKAAFFGHDHVNDFHLNIDGIDLYQTIGAGYFSYGKEHGGRLIILNENEPEKIDTRIIEVSRVTDVEL